MHGGMISAFLDHTCGFVALMGCERCEKLLSTFSAFIL